MKYSGRGGGTTWGLVGWCAGILLLLVGMPLAARGRLPETLATHWSGSGEADSSMSLWAAALFPALLWAVLVAGLAVASRHTGPQSRGPVRGWTAVTLAAGGVFLVGVQASVTRANLDRSDWREAGSVTGGGVATVVVAAAAGALAWLATRRSPAAPGRAADGPSMDLPEGQRLVWFSRTSNPWLQLTSAVTGLVALAAVVAAVGGLAETIPALTLVVPFVLASVLVLSCASVQARVGEEGLRVSFGPQGWPARRWALQDIEVARVEHRTPAQVGGWGYRLSGLGTTVMLRRGECLVVRVKGKDFAVSVDDAERGAALLNSLGAKSPR
ncbi:DUF1648 domain-containing protein [Streptomyces sp. NPDC004562]|uniref:DUF1648 domain-containing protein n=1 Tax=Streptomyces sp. NPDC004562 TaxID=3364703 RepID=UPI0036AB4DD1